MELYGIYYTHQVIE